VLFWPRLRLSHERYVAPKDSRSAPQTGPAGHELPFETADLFINFGHYEDEDYFTSEKWICGQFKVFWVWMAPFFLFFAYFLLQPLFGGFQKRDRSDV